MTITPINFDIVNDFSSLHDPLLTSQNPLSVRRLVQFRQWYQMHWLYPSEQIFKVCISGEKNHSLHGH